MLEKKDRKYILYPASETQAIFTHIGWWRNQVCDWFGLPYDGSALNKDQVKWIRNKVDAFYSNAPEVLDRLHSYKTFGRDAYARTSRSSCRAFVCQAYGRKEYYELHMCFGKITDLSLIHI